jgi:hypothetical protein
MKYWIQYIYNISENSNFHILIAVNISIIQIKFIIRNRSNKVLIRLEVNGSNPESSILIRPFVIHVTAANKILCNISQRPML